MKEDTHAESPVGEYTLCGWAFDAGQIETDAPNIVFAQAGELVTCKNCRLVIAACKTVKRWRMPRS